MYLHVGNRKNIRKRDIIGIFDADRTTSSGITKKYLAKAEKAGQVDSAGEELPKAFVVYMEHPGGDGQTKPTQKVCFSQLAVSTLLKRTEE